MKVNCLVAACLLLPAFSAAETLRLRSGADLEAGVLSIDPTAVLLEDGRRLPRAEVTEIQFSSPQKEKAAVSRAVSPEEITAAKAAFAKARELSAGYPGVNGLVLLDSGTEILKPDGTRVSRNHQVRQILKESLKQRWGRLISCAEEGRARVKILKASVYNPDGSIYPLEPERIKTSRPQSEGGSFFVSGSICTQYLMPNVQTGSIVDYVTEHETYNPFRKDFFFPSWGFQDSEGPVGLSEISVSVPEGKELFYSVKNFTGPGKPEVSSAGGMKTWYWKLENVPPLVAEPSMPSYEDFAPYVRGAVFKDWDRLFDWTGGMYEERTKPSEELKKFTLELVKDAKTEEEQAARIYHYVQKEIRYIAVKVGIASGWGGYDANLTWKRRYGCCIDKALLMTTMLGAAGIKSSPILLNTNTGREVDFSVPQMGFNHAITVAEVGGRHVFLDSTNFDYRYPEIASFDYGVHVLNIFAKKIDYVPVPEPRGNGNHYDYTIAVSSDGSALVSEKMRYTGSREGALRSYYRSIKKEEQKRAFQGFAKSVAPSAELLSYEVNNAEKIEEPFTMGLKYAVPDYAQRAGNIRIFKLPDFEIEPFRISEISLDKRRYPIEYDASMGRYYSYEIDLPENYEVVSLPERTKLSNKHASFAAACGRPADNRIACSVSWERTSRIIPPGDYPEYKAFIEKLAGYTKSQIFFKVKEN